MTRNESEDTTKYTTLLESVNLTQAEVLHSNSIPVKSSVLPAKIRTAPTSRMGGEIDLYDSPRDVSLLRLAGTD